MKKLPILTAYHLTEDEFHDIVDGLDEWETEDAEHDYYFRIGGALYRLMDFQDASCPEFEAYIDELYPDRILEDKLIRYITFGAWVVGALVINLYGDETYTLFNFKFD